MTMSALRTLYSLLTGIIGVSLLIACSYRPCAAQSFDHQVSQFFSGTGSILFLAAGTGLPLIEDGKAGKNHTLRALDGLITSELLTEGLKSLTREKRPDRNTHDSFPSSHAVSAF